MIGGGGTVVLAMHQTELFHLSDHLVVMDGGKQVFNGKYSFAGVKHLFPTLVDDEAVEPHQMSEQQGLLVTSQRPKESKKLRPLAPLPVDPPKKARVSSMENTKMATPSDVTNAPAPASTVTSSKNIYVWYFKILGFFLFLSATLLYIVGQIVRVYGDIWICVWTNRKFEDKGFTSDSFYAGVYCSLVFAFL